jgi:hypothetical protein
MGGYGSGWQGAKKDVVDHCVVLSIKELIRARVLVPGSYKRGSLTWRSGSGEVCAEFEYESEFRQDGTGSLFLRYIGAGQQFCHWVSLRSTVPHFGGRRWWFLCPLKGIRAAKLYLPAGATKFASRKAYDLTYRSCQSSWRLERVRARTERLVRRMAESEARFRAVLK